MPYSNEEPHDIFNATNDEYPVSKSPDNYDFPPSFPSGLSATISQNQQHHQYVGALVVIYWPNFHAGMVQLPASTSGSLLQHGCNMHIQPLSTLVVSKKHYQPRRFTTRRHSTASVIPERLVTTRCFTTRPTQISPIPTRLTTIVRHHHG